MSRRRTLIVAAILIVTIGLWWNSRTPESRHQKPPPVVSILPSPTAVSSPSPSDSVQGRDPGRKKAVENILGALGQPITFYGKVIDQNGAPIVDATVNYTALDRFDESGTQYQGRSDNYGQFTISSIRGAVLSVGVRKEGYYPILNRSNGSFAYGIASDSTRRAPPTREDPAVFVLQKHGLAESLIKVASGQIDIPRDGQERRVDLATGKTGRGDFQIESWIGDTNQRRYDWRYRLSVVGGGLIERTGQFDFEAPMEGYLPAFELNMPSGAEPWHSRLTKEYFASLPDGRYARFSIRFYPGSRNFVVLESYLNPKPGDRNLEFDPNKQVKSSGPQR
jgi:hypothetical protein